PCLRRGDHRRRHCLAELHFFIPLSFFFKDAATTEIYTLSLHDALPIFIILVHTGIERRILGAEAAFHLPHHAGLDPQIRSYGIEDRKSTRLNSSHVKISYAVFCLKKKKKRSRGHVSDADAGWQTGAAPA